MTKRSGNKSLDLGELQTEVEEATKSLRAAQNAFHRATLAFNDAEERYNQANKALMNGVQTLRGSTKMIV